MPVNPDYRENQDRALFLTGSITQDLVNTLVPQIVKLRQNIDQPITVYIDSPGGIVALSERLRRLIIAPDADGRRPRLISVVTGMAASAAADFLSLSDYAIVHSHCGLHYHGVRLASTDVTVERAAVLASNLQETNETRAIRLARRAFSRLPLRLSLLPEFKKFRESDKEHALEKLAIALGKQVSSNAKPLIYQARSCDKSICLLRAFVFNYLDNLGDLGKLSSGQFDVELLKAIAQFKLTQHAKDNWNLERGGLEELCADYRLFRDFHFGEQRSGLDSILAMQGALFLSKKQSIELRKLEKSKDFNDQKKVDWIREAAGYRIERLWYFTVSFCRALHSDEFGLSPRDAFWLGLVDEVPGSGLITERVLIESIPDTNNTTS